LTSTDVLGTVGVVGVAGTIDEAEQACERALMSVRGEAIYVRHDIGKAEVLRKRVEHMAEIRK
jgi:phosphoribosylamine--glycine ligase